MSSAASSTTQLTRAWDPYEVLMITQRGRPDFTCIGTTAQEARCQGRLSAYKRSRAMMILQQLGQPDTLLDTVKGQLRELATTALCESYHHHQVEEVVEKWMNSVKAVCLSTPRTGSAVAGGQTAGTGVGNGQSSHSALVVSFTDSLLLPSSLRLNTRQQHERRGAVDLTAQLGSSHEGPMTLNWYLGPATAGSSPGQSSQFSHVGARHRRQIATIFLPTLQRPDEESIDVVEAQRREQEEADALYAAQLQRDEENIDRIRSNQERQDALFAQRLQAEEDARLIRRSESVSGQALNVYGQLGITQAQTDETGIEQVTLGIEGVALPDTANTLQRERRDTSRDTTGAQRGHRGQRGALRNVQRRSMTEECPICFEICGNNGQKVTWCESQCGYNFHRKCIGEWHTRLQSHERTCPNCRAIWANT